MPYHSRPSMGTHMVEQQARRVIAAAITTAAAVVAVVLVRRQQRAGRRTGQDSSPVPLVFAASVEVECAAAKAFDLLVNTDRYATGPGSPVRRMERIPEGDACVGTRWREVIRVGVFGHMTVWSEIVALDPPTSLELRFQLPGASGRLTYRIVPGLERDTRISQEQTFVVSGRLAGIRRWMIERLWTPRAAARLRDIRAILESQEAADVEPDGDAQSPAGRV
jgi:hypothetical protein